MRIMRAMLPPPPSALIVGGLLGIMIALWWPALKEGAQGVFDTTFPVVTATSTLVARTDDAIDIALVFTKRRDCVYQRAQAYVRTPGAVLTAINVERMDTPETKRNHPPGHTYSGGTWRMWPIHGAYSVVFYAQHECDGRLVSTLLAEHRL